MVPRTLRVGGYSRFVVEPVSVVAVVLSCGGGEDGEAVAGLTSQGYPGLRMLGVDEVGDVEGGFLLFVHGDVVLEAGALAAMVAAAEEHGAGVVGPKLVSWDDPRRLLEFGCTVDRTGAVMPLAERGDLDQGQYDELVDVFAVPGACLLVRAEVFRAVGGFDAELGPLADDIGLCWRARLAGARVVVAPAARARHRETPGEQLSRGAVARRRLRAVLTGYGPAHTIRVLPQVVATGMAETAGALVTARPADAAAVVGAWGWNLWHCRSLVRARRRVRAFRQVPDAEVRRHQTTGVMVHRLAARRIARDEGPPAVAPSPTPDADPATEAAPAPPDSDRPMWTAGTIVIAVALAGVLVFGSRHLLTRGVPAIGELLPFALPGVGGLARTLITVGLVPVGVAGAAAALRPSRGHAAIAAAVAYAALPIPYAALADGRWSPLALYAILPWWLHELGWLDGLTGGWRSADRLRRVLVLGMATALAGAVVPAAPLLLVGTAGALALGGWAAFRPEGSVRVVATAAGGALIALVLQLPWSADLAGWRASLAADGAPVDPLDVLGLGGARWALVVVALLPLVLGRNERLAGAIKLWTLALCAWIAAFVAARVGVEPPLPDDALLLVPAASAIAVAAGLAAATVEHDLAAPQARRVRRRDRRRWRAPTHARRLGLRSVAGAAVSAGLVLAVLPLLTRSLDGAWDMPQGQFSKLLTFVEQDTAARGSDVLWLADPDLAPIRHDRVVLPERTFAAFAVVDGLPRLADRWRPASQGVRGGAGQAVAAAAADQTRRLGSRLAPLGVAYVVLPRGLAPAVSGATAETSPAGLSLETTLDGQLDLERVDVDPAVAVYRNLAFRQDLVAPAVPDRWKTSWPWRIRLAVVAWSGAVAVLVLLRHRRREAATR